jgi:hypothetical protein
MTVREQPMDTEGLVQEIEAYLAAVDLCRAEGREPRWRVDTVVCAALGPSARSRRRKEQE